jgi:integrase
VRVVSSLIRIVGKPPQLVEPKSRRSRRQIDLSVGAVDALRRHRTTEIESALATGRPYDLNSFVFRRPDGRPLAVTTTWKQWQRLLRKAEVPAMPFHSARHTAATLLLCANVHVKIVSEMLGHSSVSFTLDRYSHVIPTIQREAARVMDEIIRA